MRVPPVKKFPPAPRGECSPKGLFFGYFYGRLFLFFRSDPFEKISRMFSRTQWLALTGVLVLILAVVFAPREKKVASHENGEEPLAERIEFPSPITSDPIANAEDPIAAFTSWTNRFLSAPSVERAALEAEGVQFAIERRPVMKELIRNDPREALRQAVPMVVRQQLPPSILAQLEERINEIGTLRVYQGAPLEGEPLPTRSLTIRRAELRTGKTYDARVYGRRAEAVTWSAGASLNAVAIDTDFAVNDDPYRTLEAGEIPNQEKPASFDCPVSGKSTVEPEAIEEPVAEETPAIETATETIFFCDGSHITLYGETLIMGEGSSGGAIGFTGILPAVPTPSIGVVRVLYLPTTYLDQNAVPSTEAKSYELLRDVSDFYSKSSFGKLTLVSTVTPPIKLPHTEAWYIQRDTSNGGDIDGEGASHSHARAAARRMGFDDANYDCVVMRHEGGPGSYGGLGGGSSVWLRGDSVGILAHEIGHCFGLAHANFWNTAGTSAIGAGTNSEYGDPYDNMGSSGSFPNGHYNAQAKSQVRWLPANFVQSVNQSGVYRIHAFDQTSLNPANRYAMTIVKDAQRTYWGEVRTLFPTNPWTQRGMLLGWRFPGGSGGNLQLIDTTPGTPTGNSSKDDAPISLGSTFSDFEAGIHMTAINVNDSPRYVDMIVNMGDFPTNSPPTLALTSSAEVVPVGATVTFTAAANDPDGDPLAYSWQHFGDTNYRVVEANAPFITRTFPTAGTYVVSCTVSDMKGGTTLKSRLITVGSGNSRFTISGRITALGEGLPNVIVTANSANGVVTDSDGYYTIPNLAANTYTMSPLLYGYSFGELFQNSVTVGPGFDGANFEATANSTLRIEAAVPEANELAPTTEGRFTLIRSGDNSAALPVNVNTAQGSAVKGTDYTFFPDYINGSQGFSTFTIPAGQSSLDISVRPIADTAPEGPETVKLQIGPGNGYVLTGGTSATVTIADDDSTLPKISLSAMTNSLEENAISPALVTISTAAPVVSNLNVLYSVTGTASSGGDFAALTGTAMILAGGTSVTVPIIPVNDAVSEPLETVRLAATANGAYLIDSLATSVTINLIDDDVQILNVTASDPTAAEVDLTIPGAAADTATFLFTRSGDLSNPLTVYYAVSGTHASGNAALHGVDYEALPGVIIIPAGQARANLTILPRYDGIGEGIENVLLQLGAGPTNYILGANASALVTIADHPDDKPVVEIIPLRSATEGGTNGIFRLSVRGAGTGPITLNYSLGGSATAISDYTVTTNANLTFDSGSGTGTARFTLANGNPVTMDVSIVAVNDGVAESLEELVMTATPNSAYTSFAPLATARMWVRDSSQATVYADTQVGTSGTMDTFTEGATTSPVKFYLSRTGSNASSLTVNYSLGGTATSGSDYNALSGSITIPAGANGVDLPISVINDTAQEGTETIILTLLPGSYAPGNTATLYIADNETVSQTASFTSTGSRAMENAGLVSIPVSLGSPATAPVTIEYVVDTGTRAATAVNLSTAFAPYWVRVERNGSTFSTWRSPNGTTWSQLGSNHTMDLPSEVLAGLAVTSRNDGVLSTAVFDNVTFSTPPSEPLRGRTVGYVLEQGSDIESNGVYTVIGSGAGLNSSSQDECHFLSAPVAGNFILTARVVSHSGGAAGQEAGVMIRESASFRARAVHCGTRGTGGIGMFARTSTFTSALGAGIDHTLETGQLTFGIGEQIKNIVFDLVDDTINETNETIMILLRNPNAARLGAIPQHAFTIEDDDLPPAFPFVAFAEASSSFSEDAGAVEVLVTLSAPTSGSTTVEYAVTGGSASSPHDFTLEPGTLTFAAGEILKSISVVLADDTAIEASETITISLTSPVGALNGSISSHTLSILDQDRPVVTVAAGGTNPVEGGASGSFIVTRAGSLEGDLSVAFAVSGTAGSGSDYQAIGTSIVIPDGQDTATLVVTPLQDSLNEANETIIVTLSSNAAYTLGSPGAATLTLIDDDRSTVSIVATDPEASETAGNTGLFTVTRTAPTTGALTVNLTRTGSATSGSDYSAIATSLNFSAGQVSRTISVSPLEDSVTEGDEVVTLALASGSYHLGEPAFASVTIADNDIPPTVFISSPAAQGVLLSASNGLLVTATVDDDGTPQPVTVAWSQASGPGNATFDAPGETTSGVTFSSPGSYVLQVTASDGQFSVSDQIAVQVGPALSPAGWISQDLNPSSARRGQTGLVGDVFTVKGTGSGYGSASDGAHVVTRQVQGDATIIARVTSLTGTGTPLTGITMRDTMWQGSRRAVLGCEPGDVVRFRTRATASSTDTSVTASANLPLWLRLERNATTGIVTASYATDVSGNPGTWTQIGTPTNIAMDTDLSAGLTTTSSSTSNVATGVLDNVTLAPAPIGPSVLREDESASAFATPGSSSYNATTGIYTVAGGPNGNFFHGWQYAGDFMVTARHSDATSGAGSARSGIIIRESSQAGGNAYMGRIPTGSYSGFTWTSVAGGSSSGVPTFTGKLRWIRMTRRGNQITAFHAPDVSGAPGVWQQVGQPQTVILSPNVLVGFAVNNASGVGLNTATFSSFSVAPLNTAPFLETQLVSYTGSRSTVDGTVSDDGLPNPPGAVTTTWSKRSGPGEVVFEDATAINTTVATSIDGIYNLRLIADDGQARTFDEVVLQAITGTIQITASDSQASEAGGDPGAFTITRVGGSIEAPVTVHWTIGGTATPDLDYTSPGNSIVIPANQTSVVLPINVIQDILVEPAETVTLQLASDPAYELGTAISATITITDDDYPPTLTIISPATATATVPPGVGLILEASVTGAEPLPAVTTEWSQVSGPATTTFGNSAALQTTTLFPAAGDYVLRISGTDGVSTSTALVRVKVRNNAAPPPEGQDVDAPRTGSSGLSGGVLTVSGAGFDLDTSTDEFHFYHETMDGDFDVRAHLTAKSLSDTGAHAGLMARDGLTANARHLSLTHERTADAALIARDVPAGSTANAIGGMINETAPLWLRLQRSGSQFTASVSTDGVRWKSREHNNASFPNGLRVGIVSSNGSTSAGAPLQIASFSEVSGFTSANMAPRPEAGDRRVVLLSGTIGAGASVTDDALPANPGTVTTSWAKMSGPGDVLFGNPALINANHTFTLPGTYVMRLVASDGEVKTFDDSTIIATSSRYEVWSFSRFGDDFENLAISGEDVDTDGDGLENLLEYATDSDPKLSTSDAIVFGVTEVAGLRYLSITVKRNPAAIDVAIIVEGGEELSSWSPDGLVTLTDTPTQLIVRDSVPMSTGTRRFLRVKATR
jgi:regulation of enolase protein 1 (concanavalin A-like superfamily)